jgi:hypothetical protein
MVNNSTIINNLINHLTPQIIEHKEHHNIIMQTDIKVLAWDRHKDVA